MNRHIIPGDETGHSSIAAAMVNLTELFWFCSASSANLMQLVMSYYCRRRCRCREPLLQNSVSSGKIRHMALARRRLPNRNRLSATRFHSWSVLRACWVRRHGYKNGGSNQARRPHSVRGSDGRTSTASHPTLPTASRWGWTGTAVEQCLHFTRLSKQRNDD